jgi:hypothetical protein
MADPISPPSDAASAPALEPGLWQSFMAALTTPEELFAAVRGLPGFGSPLLFASWLGFLVGLLSTIALATGMGVLVGAGRGGLLGFGPLAIPVALVASFLVTPISWALKAFFGGFIVHVVALLSGGRGTPGQSVRIAAYALAPIAFLSVASYVLAWIPLLRLSVPFAPLAMLGWWAWIVAQGVASLHGGRRTVALVLAVVGAVAVALLLRRVPSAVAFTQMLFATGRGGP